eukprot:1184502-Prorocentrum_minimum.AAC.3
MCGGVCSVLTPDWRMRGGICSILTADWAVQTALEPAWKQKQRAAVNAKSVEERKVGIHTQREVYTKGGHPISGAAPPSMQFAIQLTVTDVCKPRRKKSTCRKCRTTTRGSLDLWGVECTLAVIGTGGPSGNGEGAGAECVGDCRAQSSGGGGSEEKGGGGGAPE